MKQRIIGFDLARAYAILGMIIVNFNMIFGSGNDQTIVGQFLSLFSGNSSTIFVMLAGMGIALMTNRKQYSGMEKYTLRNTILKRALFLFVFGHVFTIFWKADILHFYGWYMFIIAFVVFLEKKYFIWFAVFASVIFHLLVLIIPFDTGWDFENLEYKDFYTINGFFRNTFYNGWNSIFPWIAYFFIGMYLGRLDWGTVKTQRNLFFTGLALYLTITALQYASKFLALSPNANLFINADYLPPFLPFVLSTVGFGLMIISICMFIGNKSGHHQFFKNLASTGQMTLTHYVAHITIGLVLFLLLADKNVVGNATIVKIEPVKPIYILQFSIVYFIASYYFSVLWSKYFKNGPLETLMRKISG